MPSSPLALATKDNASGQLSAGISAATTSIPLKTGEGANFPQPYTGSCTSAGSSTTLNSTGISAAIGGSDAVGKWIWNKTDGSVARITAVATNALTTTRLIGGTDNTWGNGDTWVIDPFVATFEKISTNAYGVQSTTQYEEALIIGRSTDILTVASDGRGYNGTTANTFDADDYVYMHVTSPIMERLKDLVGELAEVVDSDKTDLATLESELASTSNGEGASKIGVEDSATNFTGDNVEEVLAELQTNIDSVDAGALNLVDIGFGDGSDGAKTISASENLDPTTLFDYSSFQLDASQTLSVSSTNDPLIVRNTGNATINGTIDLNEKGAAAGIAGASKVSGWGPTAGRLRHAGRFGKTGALEFPSLAKEQQRL